MWTVRQLVKLCGHCRSSSHKLVVKPEKAQTLTQQAIAPAVASVTVLDGRSHRYGFHLRVSVVGFFPPNSQYPPLNALTGRTFVYDLKPSHWKPGREECISCV